MAMYKATTDGVQLPSGRVLRLGEIVDVVATETLTAALISAGLLSAVTLTTTAANLFVEKYVTGDNKGDDIRPESSEGIHKQTKPRKNKTYVKGEQIEEIAKTLIGS